MAAGTLKQKRMGTRKATLKKKKINHGNCNYGGLILEYTGRSKEKIGESVNQPKTYVSFISDKYNTTNQGRRK